MDTSWYCNLLHSDEFGVIAVEASWGDGKHDPNVPMRVMITENGKAAHCRDDWTFLLKSFPIQTPSWCSHCDPSDTLEKRTLEAARWIKRTSFEPQCDLYQFPVL